MAVRTNFVSRDHREKIQEKGRILMAERGKRNTSATHNEARGGNRKVVT